MALNKNWIFEIIDKTSVFAKQLITDHFDRHESDSIISKGEAKILNEIYGTLWMDAYYDPPSAEIQKYAKPIADKLSVLNKTLKFKE
jgi:hypothetical protein